MHKIFQSRLENTSKMLLHWVQDVRRAVKKSETMNALRSAREALNMASWVITYASSLTVAELKKEQP